jgi:hypothetical protein
VSRNREEDGDLGHNVAERNIVWVRLAGQHKTMRFALLLHGGDQIYADEATKGHALNEDWLKDIRADPTKAVGQGGRAMMKAARDSPFAGRTFLMSSAPLLAPQLLPLEGVMRLNPRILKYEDDLRDQWQNCARHQGMAAHTVLGVRYECGGIVGAERWGRVVPVDSLGHFAPRTAKDLGTDFEGVVAVWRYAAGRSPHPNAVGALAKGIVCGGTQLSEFFLTE